MRGEPAGLSLRALAVFVAVMTLATSGCYVRMTTGRTSNQGPSDERHCVVVTPSSDVPADAAPSPCDEPPPSGGEFP